MQLDLLWMMGGFAFGFVTMGAGYCFGLGVAYLCGRN